ncbi:MAG: hypothetical protein E7223_01920 [Clostridiales bacterium]|nr:hypothetical protein [Clostridiales bacterium]
MKIKITYPPVGKKRIQRKKLLNILRWPFLLAAVLCPVINLTVGGKAWSVIVLMGLYMVWKLGLSTDLVEYNRTSQTAKTIITVCLLLFLIDFFLSGGWAVEVIPVVGFCGLVVAGVLFFTDFQRQQQNMLPLLLLILLALAGAVVGLTVWNERAHWPFLIMGGFALALLIACIATMGGGFLRMLRRRFHIK